jgi:hypothetical protein
MSSASGSPITSQGLSLEKARWQGSAGCSAGNRGLGFRPAFLDTETGRVYLSAFADGRPAPVHVLDGLPQTLVVARSAGGRVCAVKASMVSGFARDARFYTREEAMRAADDEASQLVA